MSSFDISNPTHLSCLMATDVVPVQNMSFASSQLLSSSPASACLMDTKRQRVERSCLAAASCPKVTLAKILLALHSEGALASGLIADDSDEESVRKSIAASASDLGNRMTPFGTVVQKMTIGITPPFQWTFIHPLALIYMLTQVSIGFAKLLKDTVDTHGMLSIVLFVDEIRPGNVLRPDLGRATQDIFWTFAEFPDWYVVKDDAWLVFGGIRSAIVNKIEGDMSVLMAQVLHVFFSPQGPNFKTTGGILVLGNEQHLFKARFAGFLGDEKGLKEVYASKGPASTRPCLSCLNIVQFLDHILVDDGYLVSVKCPDSARFVKSSDANVFEAADQLKRAKAHMTKAAFADLEQQLGLHYVPGGVLYDDHCRSLVRPVKGWFRDWMHVMAVQGCGNIELEQLIHELRRYNVLPSMISGFFSKVRMPRTASKIDADWFTTKRVGKASAEKDGWKGFSSEVLTIVPIMLFFVQTAVQPTGHLLRHIECFRLLDKLLKLFCLGSEAAAKYKELIRTTISRHAALFAELYPDVRKPKFHHVFHIVDHIENMGRLLSCFVCERKHRQIKHVANHLFRHFETALTTDILNLIVDRYSNRQGMFAPEHLVKPTEIDAKMLHNVGLREALQTSFRADLKCGAICKGDMVMLADRSIAEVLAFAAIADADGSGAKLVCLLQPFDGISGNRHKRSAKQPIVARSSDIVEALMYVDAGDALHALPPKVSATW